MNKWKLSIGVLIISILISAQYILAFFVYKLPGCKPLQWLGWGIWIVSLIFAIAPMLILKNKGGVAQGKSYVETTHLVDSSLYAIVRHPQYTAGIMFNLALMLLAQHWVVFLLGIVSMILIYLEIQEADREGIQKFGEEYKQYMKRVPQMNLLLGIYRIITKADGKGS